MNSGVDVLAVGLSIPETAVPVAPAAPDEKNSVPPKLASEDTITVEYLVEFTIEKPVPESADDTGEDAFAEFVMTPEAAVPTPPELPNPCEPEPPEYIPLL